MRRNLPLVCVVMRLLAWTFGCASPLTVTSYSPSVVQPDGVLIVVGPLPDQSEQCMTRNSNRIAGAFGVGVIVPASIVAGCVPVVAPAKLDVSSVPSMPETSQTSARVAPPVASGMNAVSPGRTARYISRP